MAARYVAGAAAYAAQPFVFPGLQGGQRDLVPGVDISLGVLTSEFMKVTWGRLALINGLRWGGGGPVDRNNLIPLDWRHVDRGPRRQ